MIQTADDVVESKTVIVSAIAVLLMAFKLYTGSEFPISAEQILAVYAALVVLIRVFMTKEKITSFLPKKKYTNDAATEQ